MPRWGSTSKIFGPIGGVGRLAAFNAATGGTISTYTSGSINYKLHAFTTNGTFTPSLVGRTFEVLLVGGGGGCGGWREGNYGPCGGGGGVQDKTGVNALTLTATGYSIVIGGGGGNGISRPAGDPYEGGGAAGANGGASTGFGYTAAGGGGGWYNYSDYASTSGSSGAPQSNAGTVYVGGSAGVTSSITNTSTIYGAGGGVTGQGNYGGGGLRNRGGGPIQGAVYVRYAVA